MPELPDITVYIEALEARILGQTLDWVRLASPFLLRTIDPPLSAAQGKKVQALRRIGKRIAIGLEDDLWLVLHLMIAGRLHWRERGAKLARQEHARGFRFFQRLAGSHRGRFAEDELPCTWCPAKTACVHSIRAVSTSSKPASPVFRRHSRRPITP